MSYLCIGIKVFRLRQSWPSFVSNAHILFNLFFLIRQWLEAIYLLLLVVTSQCNFFALFQQGPKKRSGRSFLKSSNTQNFLVFLGFFFSRSYFVGQYAIERQGTAKFAQMHESNAFSSKTSAHFFFNVDALSSLLKRRTRWSIQAFFSSSLLQRHLIASEEMGLVTHTQKYFLPF